MCGSIIPANADPVRACRPPLARPPPQADYWCTTPVAGSFFWRFFASQKSNNNRIEKADSNDLRLTLALRMAPVPLKTTGQNLTSIILSAKKNFRLQASCTNTLTSERSASLLVICLPTQVRPNKSYWPLIFVRVQSCFIGLRGSKRNLCLESALCRYT